jgi:hypothetical protein
MNHGIEISGARQDGDNLNDIMSSASQKQPQITPPTVLKRPQGRVLKVSSRRPQGRVVQVAWSHWHDDSDSDDHRHPFCCILIFSKFLPGKEQKHDQVLLQATVQYMYRNRASILIDVRDPSLAINGYQRHMVGASALASTWPISSHGFYCSISLSLAPHDAANADHASTAL